MVYSGSPAASVTEQSRTMKLILATIILGWVAVVTFAGPDLAKFIDRSLPGHVAKPAAKRAK